MAGWKCVITHLNDFTLTGIHIFTLEHHLEFNLRRWALKIMSLVISANRLFAMTQSRHLRSLLEGKFVIQVLTPPTTSIPYCCNLSPETIQVALDAVLTGTTYLSAKWDKKRESFIQQLLNDSEPEASVVVVREKPTVHVELAMIMATEKGEIENVFPHIGVSKHSCIMCSHYILAFNEVTKQNITTKSCHGKAYPGWCWPCLPSHDEKLHPAFLRHIRQQLLRVFRHQTATWSPPSDSSMESVDFGPRLYLDNDLDNMIEQYLASNHPSCQLLPNLFTIA